LQYRIEEGLIDTVVRQLVSGKVPRATALAQVTTGRRRRRSIRIAQFDRMQAMNCAEHSSTNPPMNETPTRAVLPPFLSDKFRFLVIRLNGVTGVCPRLAVVMRLKFIFVHSFVRTI
jgi:hypothetical protein